MKFGKFALVSVLFISPLYLHADDAKKKEPVKKEEKKDSCGISITGTDQMSFQMDGKKLESINVPKGCKTFKVHLEYSGKLGSSTMGHNFNVTEEKDAEAVYNEILKIGADKEYKIADLKKKPFDKLLATSNQLVGGGEKDVKSVDVEINMKKFNKGKKYKFFCAFPGHFGIMNGTFIVN